MCEEYLQDVNPDESRLMSLAEQSRPERIRLDELNEVDFRSDDDYYHEDWDRCILRFHSRPQLRGDEVEIEESGWVNLDFPVKSIRNIGKCCWRILR